MKRIICIIFSACLLSACQSGLPEDSPYSEEFLELLDYEIQNRAFALAGIGDVVKQGPANPAHALFKAYLDLEHLNQEKYAPYAAKYGLDMQPRWWTRTRTSLGGMVPDFIADSFLSFMHEKTVAYVAKLEALEALAPDEDKAFFAYVVAQEQAQADALGLLLKGNIDDGAKRLRDFVTAQTRQ